LYKVDITEIDSGTLLVDLVWGLDGTTDENSSLFAHPSSLPIVFVHVVGADGLMAQDDALPAAGQWQAAWWQPGLLLRDRHEIVLPDGAAADDYQFYIGMYDADTRTRLPVVAAAGNPLGDVFIWPDHGASE
jgi:hypothetical protein